MIGLLTLQYADNYGAVLQAYALQKKIGDLGYACEYINFFPNPRAAARVRKPAALFRRALRLLHPIKLKRVLHRRNAFAAFRKKHLHISGKIYRGDSAMHVFFPYDGYIVGSDQVWNFKITNASKAYLLDFVPKGIRKSSYASSFGLSNLGDEKTLFGELLSSFDDLSVREATGADIINDITGRKAVRCLDPTMLLKRSEWSAVAAAEPSSQKYVLIYAMTDTPSLVSAARTAAKKLSCKKIISIGLKESYRGISALNSASPEQWLGCIMNAEAVITNSFHGTAFSIVFQRNFFIEYLPETWEVNSRLKDIVSLLKLEERIVANGCIQNVQIPNYDEINILLDAEREKSIEYLKGVCSHYDKN